MTRMVKCIKLGRDAEGLDLPPYPGELGKRIYENVSKEAWQAWIKHQTMLINENKLNLADPRAIAITSTGSGNLPSTGTSFDSSAMQTNFFATAATIFSRVSAPPPPFIMARCSVISSAPSM